MDSSMQEKNDFLIRLLSCGDKIEKYSSGFKFNIENDCEIIVNNIKSQNINIIIKQLTNINEVAYIDNWKNLKPFLDALIEKYTIQKSLLHQKEGLGFVDDKHKYINLLKKILMGELLDNEFDVVIEDNRLNYNIKIKGKKESLKIEIPLNGQIVDNSDEGLLSIINITFHIMSDNYYKVLDIYMPYYEVITYPMLKNKLGFSLPSENFNDWVENIKQLQNNVSSESQKKLSYVLLDKELNKFKTPNKNMLKKQKI